LKIHLCIRVVALLLLGMMEHMKVHVIIKKFSPRQVLF